MTVAIIPARGGSKRIKRKNIKEFLGRPIVCYPIELLQSCQLFDRIIVSSDDTEILDIANKHNAEALLRPSELSDDYATTRSVVIHAINALALEDQTRVCCVYPTAVLLKESALREGLNSLEHFSFSLAVVEYDAPVWRGFVRSVAGGLDMLYPEHINSRSQDLQTVWHDAGQFYWGCAKDWIDESIALFGLHSYGVAVSTMNAQDIDNESDWLIAELKYKLRK